jgi:hypothetical protein
MIEAAHPVHLARRFVVSATDDVQDPPDIVRINDADDARRPTAFRHRRPPDVAERRAVEHDRRLPS